MLSSYCNFKTVTQQISGQDLLNTSSSSHLRLRMIMNLNIESSGEKYLLASFKNLLVKNDFFSWPLLATTNPNIKFKIRHFIRVWCILWMYTSGIFYESFIILREKYSLDLLITQHTLVSIFGIFSYPKTLKYIRTAHSKIIIF